MKKCEVGGIFVAATRRVALHLQEIFPLPLQGLGVRFLRPNPFPRY